MTLGTIDPLNFVIGRQLALNQNVDNASATRHGLLGALIGQGMMGPVLARELSRREAEKAAAAAPILSVSPPSTPDTEVPVPEVSNADIKQRFQQLHADMEKLLKDASALKCQAAEAEADRKAIVRELCDRLCKLGASASTEPEPATAPPG